MSDTSYVDDDINTRHRKERKDLQAKVQSLKKSASKGDKKKRKDILEEIAKLEIDLEKRQAQELNELNSTRNGEAHTNTASEENPSSPTAEEDASEDNHPQRVSKAQKRRDKKAKEEKEREAAILVQEELNKNGPRMLEHQTIVKRLKERQLCIHPIASDGDCLYNAVRHQLELTNRGHREVAELRNKTANYILRNKDNLIFYMTNPNTGDILSDDEFTKYCEAIRDTPAWGGQIEIKALSNVLEVPIEVVQATGPPTIQGDEEFSQPNLTITYHRHMYSLGEHYNSTRPIVTGEEADEVCNGES